MILGETLHSPLVVQAIPPDVIICYPYHDLVPDHYVFDGTLLIALKQVAVAFIFQLVDEKIKRLILSLFQLMKIKFC